MDEKNILQSYVNDFRRHLSPLLKPGIGITSVSTPSISGGAVFEFELSPQAKNEDEYRTTVGSVNEVLKVIPQNIVSGNIDSVKFSGTNISMEPNRILIIKGEDNPDLYNDDGAKNDVNRIIDVIKRSHQ